MNWLMLNQE